MKNYRLLLWIMFWVIPQWAHTQENNHSEGLLLEAVPEPIELGLRYDDNVFRSVSLTDRLSDEIYGVNLGGEATPSLGIFKSELEYHLGVDQYQLYSVLNNQINDFNLSLSVNPTEWSFSYKKEFYLRTSNYSDFNYFDDNNLIDIQWAPAGSREYETGYKYYSRNYYDQSNSYQSRDFVDQEFLLIIQQQVNDRLSLKIEGNYNNRQFNRDLVVVSEGVTYSPPSLQTDSTWTGSIGAHLYYDSIYQDINFEHQRTNSNSYGFSNTVESVSWAAVIRPDPSLYLQLFFRLYSKIYDVAPLVNPNLQIGYVDEDSQDLLSIKGSWEWNPQWIANISLSRLRDESTQPGEFYIKNLISLEIQKKF